MAQVGGVGAVYGVRQPLTIMQASLTWETGVRMAGMLRTRRGPSISRMVQLVPLSLPTPVPKTT